MIEIKVSTPQPLDCPKCKAKYGYKVAQKIQKYIDIIYDKYGNYNGCVYSNSERILGTLKLVFCANCNTKLPFKCRE